MLPRIHRTRSRLAVAALAPALLALLSLAACAAGSSDSGTDDAKPSVVTSVAPLAWLTGRLSGGESTVTNLAGTGTDPHHFELSPRQLIDVERADLVIYIEGLQPAMDDAVAQHAQDSSLDVTSVVDMLPADGHDRGHSTGRDSSGEGGNGHGGQEDGDRSHAHDHATYDPHVWLDPVRFADVAARLGDRLAKIDPAHAEAYRHRAHELTSKLDRLDREYSRSLRDCESDLIVTNHQAFGYLAERYGLEQVGIRATLDASSRPSPARVAEITRLADAGNVRTIFFDESTNADLANAVADEIGADTASLDPITRRSEDGSGNYFDAMQHNLNTLHDSLGCK